MRTVAQMLCACVFMAAGGCAARRPAQVSMAPLPPLSESAPQVGRDVSDSYRLIPGDVVRIKFLYHPELDTKVAVLPDGRAAIQGVGELHAAGITTAELAERIEEITSDRLREPEVTVSVADLGAHKVYVGGEVRAPGYVTYQEGLTPLQAILDRGGFTDFARTDSVLRLRVQGRQYSATRLDLSNTILDGTPDLTEVAVSDVIFVPRTFIGDANAFVRYYIRGLLPTTPRANFGVGFSP